MKKILFYAYFVYALSEMKSKTKLLEPVLIDDLLERHGGILDSRRTPLNKYIYVPINCDASNNFDAIIC